LWIDLKIIAISSSYSSYSTSVFQVTLKRKLRLSDSEEHRMILTQNMTFSRNLETPKKRTFKQQQHLVGQTRYTKTRYLPINAEARMVGAVRFATSVGAPINTLLTVNAAHLQRIGSNSIFDIGHLWDGHQDFIELLRKWLTHRNIVWASIWAREYTGGKNEHHGEHWHIALHLPPRHQDALAAQIATWTDEAIGPHDGKKKCIARSLTGAWYLNRRKENAGEYLGKATPKTRLRYGKRISNDLRTTRHYGGEGPIEGKRFGISRPIGDTAQRRHGWQ
jgi:hypothetical protein